MFFEYCGSKWLVDTGASAKFYENAQSLGVDLSAVDYLILTHAHNDHTGGAYKFLEVNSKAKIYVSKHIFGNKYFSSRRVEMREIGFREEVFSKHLDRFILVENDCQIVSGIDLVSEISIQYACPVANKTLFKSTAQNVCNDDFNHEIALRIHTPSGFVVISSCSHKGVLNTLQSTTRGIDKKSVVAYVGGCHLPNGDFETSEEITQIAQNILSLYPNIILHTGHCTESVALNILSDTMKQHFEAFYTGKIIRI